MGQRQAQIQTQHSIVGAQIWLYDIPCQGRWTAHGHGSASRHEWRGLESGTRLELGGHTGIARRQRRRVGWVENGTSTMYRVGVVRD